MTHTSREYAEALFELAAEEDRGEACAEALDTVEQALEENPGFLDTLASPAIPREERMDMLSAAFQGRIPLSVLVLMRMMVYRGHARSLPEMIAAYRDLARERSGMGEARVFSAVALTEEEREALRQKLEKRFGRKMTLDCQVDPDLLGGIRVETEGRVLDGTLRARLKEIRGVMEP